jgi:hypothetical protein
MAIFYIQIQEVLAYLSVEILLASSAQLVAVCAQCYLIAAGVEEVPYPQAQVNTLREMRRLGQRSCHNR